MPMVYNARTGKFKPKNMTMSRIAKKSHAQFKGKKRPAAVKMKIKKTLLKNSSDGKNRFGRKLRRR